jgi:hypothetical protein
MPRKESTSKTVEQRPPRRADGASRQEAAPEKPPESAEDFEHTLRRLISARGANRSSEGRA